MSIAIRLLKSTRLSIKILRVLSEKSDYLKILDCWVIVEKYLITACSSIVFIVIKFQFQFQYVFIKQINTENTPWCPLGASRGKFKSCFWIFFVYIYVDFSSFFQVSEEDRRKEDKKKGGKRVRGNTEYWKFRKIGGSRIEIKVEIKDGYLEQVWGSRWRSRFSIPIHILDLHLTFDLNPYPWSRSSIPILILDPNPWSWSHQFQFFICISSLSSIPIQIPIPFSTSISFPIVVPNPYPWSRSLSSIPIPILIFAAPIPILIPILNLDPNLNSYPRYQSQFLS
jgi:hypothetical protein